jgi:hypothetical protein
MNTYTYQIAGYYLSSMINGDDSGLEDSDLDTLAAFMECNPMGMLHVLDDEPSFRKCDVCGLLADCYTIEAYGI